MPYDPFSDEAAARELAASGFKAAPETPADPFRPVGMSAKQSADYDAVQAKLGGVQGMRTADTTVGGNAYSPEDHSEAMRRLTMMRDGGITPGQFARGEEPAQKGPMLAFKIGGLDVVDDSPKGDKGTDIVLPTQSLNGVNPIVGNTSEEQKAFDKLAIPGGKSTSLNVDSRVASPKIDLNKQVHDAISMPPEKGAAVAPQSAPQVASKSAAPQHYVGPQTIKAHFDDSQVPFRKSTLAEGDRIAAASKSQLGTDGLHREIENEIMSGQQQLELDAIEKKQRENVAHEAARQTEMAKQRAELDETIADAKASELDGRSYLERNPASGIALAIGAALGGALAGMQGRDPNEALRPLNNAIGRDIQMQKDQLAKKQSNVDNQSNLIARLRQTYGDDRAVDLAAEITMQHAASARLGQIADSHKTMQIRDAATAAQLLLDKSANEKQMNLDQMAHVAARTTGAGNAGSKVQRDLEKRFIPWAGGYVRDEADRQKVTEIGRNGIYLKDRLNKLIPYAEKIGTVDKLGNKVSFTTENMANLRANLMKIMQPLNTFKGGGAMAEHEAKIQTEAIIGGMRLGEDPTKFIRDQIVDVDDTLEATKRSYGLQNGQEVYGMDPTTGLPAPVEVRTGSNQAPRPAMPATFKK